MGGREEQQRQWQKRRSHPPGKGNRRRLNVLLTALYVLGGLLLTAFLVFPEFHFSLLLVLFLLFWTAAAWLGWAMAPDGSVIYREGGGHMPPFIASISNRTWAIGWTALSGFLLLSLL